MQKNRKALKAPVAQGLHFGLGCVYSKYCVFYGQYPECDMMLPVLFNFFLFFFLGIGLVDFH